MSGEICPNCQPVLTALQDRIAGLEHTLRSQASTIGRLKREDENVRDHDQWNRCARLFKIWQRATGHTRSRFTPARFKDALPHLLDYEDEVIERAIEGIAYDPYVPPANKNGLREPQDGWDTLFKSSDRIERYANRAPLNWKDTLMEHAAEVDARQGS